MRLIIEKARVSFANSLFTPQKNDNGKLSYNCHLLIPKTDEGTVRLVIETMRKVAIDKWGNEGGKILKGLKAAGRVFMRKGDEKPDYEGYEGMIFLSVRSHGTKPKLLNKDKSPVTEEQGTLYSGCYVYAVLEVYAQDHKTYGKRINCSIGGLMVIEDGESLGITTRASDEDFPDIADTGDELGVGEISTSSKDEMAELLGDGVPF
jgi:hypothetical protein